MKKNFLICVLSLFALASFGQSSDATLNTLNSSSIQGKTYSSTSAYNMNSALISSKLNVDRIGVTVQAYNAKLAALAALANSSGFLKNDGSGNFSWAVPFTLTTTGSSGAATFSAGTLNIPQYSGGGGTVATLSEALAGTNDAHFMSPLKNNYVNQRAYNVKAYGALGDGQRTTANLTASSTAFTASGFTAGDIGKLIKLSGAGAAGVPLTTTIANVSGTTITLTVAPSTSVTGSLIVWGTDDTAAIQAAINACAAAGGGVVYAPNGVYLINGSLVTSDINGHNPNSQLYIPAPELSGDTNGLRVQIRIVGEATNTYPVLFGTSVAQGGTIFYSLLSNPSGTNPSVFSTYGTTPDIFNETDIVIENVNLLCYSNNGAHATYLTGWNLLNFGTAEIINSNPNIDAAVQTSVTQLGSGTVGIAIGRIYDNGKNIINRCSVGGFENGFVVGDHTQIINCGAYGNIYGITPINQTHTVYGMLTLEANAVAIRFPTGSTFMGYPIGTYSPVELTVAYEYSNGGTHWYDSQYLIEDLSSPSRGRGKVTFTNFGINDSDLIDLNHFTTGTLGISLIPANNFAPRQFTTAVGGLVTHGNEWTKDQAIIESSSGVAATQFDFIGQFQATTNQPLTTDGEVGKFSFINSAIGSSTNQVSWIDAYTDGAINNGKMRFVTMVSGTPTVAFAATSSAVTFSRPVVIDLAKSLTVTEGTDGRAGQTTLVSGTKAITIAGLTTASRAFVQLVTASGTTSTVTYQAVCTANTLTVRANVAAGTINTSDGSTLNYIIYN